MVKTLRSAWPSTQLTWIIGSKEAPLVQHLENIRFMVFDKAHNLRSFRAIKATLANETFDILVLAQTSIRANLLSLAIQAKRRVGFGGAHAREGHRWFVNEPVELPECVHQAEALFAFAPYLLGRPELSLQGADRSVPIPAKALDFAQQHQPIAKQAVLISPCSSHPLRNWHASGYAAVADWVIEHLKRPVILIGGPSQKEKAMGLAIEAAMRSKVTNLIGQDTLDQALAMMARAYCLISPDSGPAHMADGLGTPVIGLYAATRVARSGPWASQTLCVEGFDQAARQFRHKKPEQLPWSTRIERPGVMDIITPEAVIEKLALLGQLKKAHA